MATTTWLVTNPRSGSYDADLVETIRARCAEAGAPVARVIALGEDDLPDRAAIDAAGVGRIMILTGDGTVSALAQRLEGWDGELLVLPGGTMNLLAHALHGEAAAVDIVAGVLAGTARPVTVPVVTADGLVAYAGVIAGPTSAWGDVREDMRNLDLGGLAQSVPRALTATLGENMMEIDGHADRFAAVYVEPADGGLRAFGILADHAGQLVAHGWAWVTGDFRNGPCDPLPVAPAHVLRSAEKGARIDLLVDGEKRRGANPMTFRHDTSALRFLSLLGKADWS